MVCFGRQRKKRRASPILAGAAAVLHGVAVRVHGRLRVRSAAACLGGFFFLERPSLRPGGRRGAGQAAALHRAWRGGQRGRFFSLTGRALGCLHYSKVKNGKDLGVIRLENATHIIGTESRPKKKHVFEIPTPDRTYFLSADTEEV